jgi:UDP-glucuronate 4-epimerase
VNLRPEQRVLITGALGCIGSWTAKTLLDEGVPVVTFDKGTDRKRLELIMGRDAAAAVEAVEGDITDLAAIEAALDDHAITSVIHLAALQVPFARANPPLGAAVNVVGTVNVLEAVKRRLDRMGPVVYAGSIGMYSRVDIAEDGVLHEDATVHSLSHYGVYKHANEGNAYVYARDDGVPSVALRPMVIYGPGRDQGLTSDPARAILAAVLGREFEIGFGGSVLFQYAPDAAAAFVRASRSQLDGARVYNLNGTLASIDAFIDALDSVVPGARALVSGAGAPLDLPEAIESTSLSELGDIAVTPLVDAIAASVALYRERLDAGELLPEEHGLT